MPNPKLRKAERKAAGMACMSLFHLTCAISHGLKQVASTHPPSGGGTGEGLTEKEREYVLKLSTRFHDNGELLRRLGWRFLK